MPSDVPPRTDAAWSPDDETTDANVRRQGRRTDPLIGRVFDERYRIVELIARGGMGRVYRAEQSPLGRQVAIKVLDPGTHDDAEFRARFIREAETCARLSHPNTVRVFDYGRSSDDILYIAMELLEGRNLFQAIQTDAPMDALRIVRIGGQVAASLREAHAIGLIHRDLKPSNIILVATGGGDEFVKVVDFGLAKEIQDGGELTRADALVGSPSYMSPEQVRSASLDQRSDVYSLGVLMYASACGRPPFTGATPLAILMGHLNQPPPPMHQVCPSMKRVPSLEAVILRCLAKEPADRYANMDAVLAALNAAEDELRGSNPRVLPAAPAVIAAPEPRSTSRAPALGLVAVTLTFGVLALASVAGLGVWWINRSPSAPPAARAAPAPIQVLPSVDPAPPPAAPAPLNASAAPALKSVTAPAPRSSTSRSTTSAEPAAVPPAPGPSPAPAVPATSAAAPEVVAPPPAAPATAPAPVDTPVAPEPARRSGSDVRDPWEKR